MRVRVYKGHSGGEVRKQLLVVTSEDCGKEYESFPFHLMPFLFLYIFLIHACIIYMRPIYLQSSQLYS